MKDFKNIAWEILFGEELDRIPDPNKPENTAYFSAKRKQEQQQLKQFVEGPGKVLMSRWKRQIRFDLIGIFGSVDTDCNCQTCWRIRKIRNIFELIIEAESVLENEK